MLHKLEPQVETSCRAGLVPQGKLDLLIGDVRDLPVLEL